MDAEMTYRCRSPACCGTPPRSPHCPPRTRWCPGSPPSRSPRSQGSRNTPVATTQAEHPPVELQQKPFLLNSHSSENWFWKTVNLLIPFINHAFIYSKWYAIIICSLCISREKWFGRAKKKSRCFMPRLKRLCHEIFLLWFFHQTTSPVPLDMPRKDFFQIF